MNSAAKSKSIIDLIGQAEVFRLMEEKMREVAAENDRLGLPKAVKVNGVVCRQYPDGRIEPVLPPDGSSKP